jgi:hypothetical protein
MFGEVMKCKEPSLSEGSLMIYIVGFKTTELEFQLVLRLVLQQVLLEFQLVLQQVLQLGQLGQLEFQLVPLEFLEVLLQ